MDYDDPFFIALYACATVAVVAAMIFAFMAVYRIEAFNRLVETAFRSERRSTFDDFTPPLYHPRRMWRIAFIVASVLGFGIILYGIFIRLFGWMPYDWRTGDGIWAAEYFSGFSAFLLLMGLFSWGTKLQERVIRYRTLERYEGEIKQYEDILLRLLTCRASGVDFWTEYGERLLRWQSKAGSVRPDEAERLITNLKIIRQYRRDHNADSTVQTWVETTVRQDLHAEWIEDAQQMSDKAANLICFVAQNRYGLELFDEGWELREMIPKSPDGWSARGMIESIIWADQVGVIDAVDDYLRNKARWTITPRKRRQHV